MLDICTSWWKLGLDSDSAWLWYKTLVFFVMLPPISEFLMDQHDTFEVPSISCRLWSHAVQLNSPSYLVFNLRLRYKMLFTAEPPLASGKRSTKDSQSSNLSFDVWRLKDWDHFYQRWHLLSEKNIVSNQHFYWFDISENVSCMSLQARHSYFYVTTLSIHGLILWQLIFGFSIQHVQPRSKV